MRELLKRIEQALQNNSAKSHLKRQLDKLNCQIELLADGKPFSTIGDYAAQTVKLKASTSVWAEIFSAKPPVGKHSLGALRRLCPEFSVEGKEITYLQALPFLEKLFEDVRAELNPGEVNLSKEFDNLSLLKGQYVDIGNQQWVYCERSGNPLGRPVLMLHTAGSDSRQWHGLMTNANLQTKFNLLAFDLPGHGRSPLPANQENWDWLLTEAQYMKWVTDLIHALNLESLLLIGCSMGSAISLGLLANHSELFSGGVLLETPYRSPGRRSIFLDHPEVHGNRLAATWVSSLLSPYSPQSRKDYATWIYSQGAPSVYDGDLAFYSDEFAATNHTAKINTTKTPLWLLTGDYDYSASPEETMKVAQEIPGAKFIRLNGFGHFPMTEDPNRLYGEYLSSVLDEYLRATNF